MLTLPKKIDFSCYCPKCGERHKKADIDGGRCTACGTTLCAVRPADFSQFVVQTPKRTFVVEAETAIQVKQVLAKRGYRVQSVVEIIQGSVPTDFNHIQKIEHVSFSQMLGKTIEAVGRGTVPGEYGNEDCIYLYFHDGTVHGCVLPTTNQDEDDT